jgi:hypothetical protein
MAEKLAIRKQDYILDAGLDEEYILKSERCQVTVCIAAICKWAIEGIGDSPVIVGASDRMLTVEDIEFQPPQTKIFPLTSSIYILIAGSAALQIEMCKKTFAEVGRRISLNPAKWFRVEEAADIFSNQIILHKKKTFSRLVLEPLGLDSNTFISRQKELSPDFLESITDEITKYKFGISAIIAGLDEEGAHIYVVTGAGAISCHDSVGFAAIGGGRRHAESEFMFAGHTPYAEFSETMLLTYSAKKRAEVAPGVGAATDMFVIGALGQATTIPEEQKIMKIDQIYQELVEDNRGANKKAKQSYADYIKTELRIAQQNIENQKLPNPKPEEGGEK